MNSGAIYIDNSTPSKITINLESCDFNLIYSKYQAGGLYVDNPSADMSMTMKDITFTNVIAYRGSAFYGLFLDLTKNFITMENITIKGNGDSDEIETTFKIYYPFEELDGEVMAKGTFTTPGNNAYFKDDVLTFGKGDYNTTSYNEDNNLVVNK